MPAHESTWHSITVMVDEVLCDLYPIHWSQLESMASFENVSSTVLLHSQIVYQRSQSPAERFRALPARLAALQQPEPRPAMLKKAQELFQRTGYSYFLLRQQSANGHLLACFEHAQQILSTVLHCLAVCNQACIDTRKLVQVLGLPKLPVGFATTVERMTQAHAPDELLSACEMLLNTTRNLLLVEQRQIHDDKATFPAAFGAGYPELKADLQHLLLACERQDLFALRGPLLSLYRECLWPSRVGSTGIEYSSFNSMTDYQQDLVALGFPALLPHVEVGDFAGLHRQCLVFDQHLRRFLTEHSVELYTFATVDELQKYLGGGSWIM